jgi:hypothetical protein
MKGKQILLWVLLIVVALALAGAVGMALAQGPEAQDDGVLPQGEVSAAAAMDDVIPIQGRLLDSKGNPINGTRTVTFTLYDASTGGTVLCTDADNVTAVNGLFNAQMDWCDAEDLNGRQVWLGIRVGGDAEMTPRQPIYAVPYAWGLRPGAVISNTTGGQHALEVLSNAGGGAASTTLNVVNESTASGIALWAQADGRDATLISTNTGTGPLFKGFGAGGGEDEIRINNNGSIETKADSYIFVPGTEAVISDGTTGVTLNQLTGGIVEIDNSTMGTKYIRFAATLPGILYGRAVTVEEVTVFYMTPPAATSWISRTRVVRQRADSCCLPDTMVDDATIRANPAWGSYSVTPTANSVLSATEGFVSVELTLQFNAPTHPITIGGVRIRLGHHSLY